MQVMIYDWWYKWQVVRSNLHFLDANGGGVPIAAESGPAGWGILLLHNGFLRYKSSLIRQTTYVLKSRVMHKSVQ